MKPASSSGSIAPPPELPPEELPLEEELLELLELLLEDEPLLELLPEEEEEEDEPLLELLATHWSARLKPSMLPRPVTRS